MLESLGDYSHARFLSVAEARQQTCCRCLSASCHLLTHCHLLIASWPPSLASTLSITFVIRSEFDFDCHRSFRKIELTDLRQMNWELRRQISEEASMANFHHSWTSIACLFDFFVVVFGIDGFQRSDQIMSEPLCLASSTISILSAYPWAASTSSLGASSLNFLALEILRRLRSGRPSDRRSHWHFARSLIALSSLSFSAKM